MLAFVWKGDHSKHSEVVIAVPNGSGIVLVTAIAVAVQDPPLDGECRPGDNVYRHSILVTDGPVNVGQIFWVYRFTASHFEA
jgi:hypothetical protein